MTKDQMFAAGGQWAVHKTFVFSGSGWGDSEPWWDSVVPGDHVEIYEYQSEDGTTEVFFFNGSNRIGHIEVVGVSKRSSTAPSAPQPRLVIVPSDAAINALLDAHRKFMTSGLGEEAMLQWDTVQEHRQALVDFGVLQQVFFPLNPIDRSSEGFAQVSAILRVEARGGPFARFEWLPGNNRSPTGVTVWCKPEDLGRWETALSAFSPGR